MLGEEPDMRGVQEPHIAVAPVPVHQVANQQHVAHVRQADHQLGPRTDEVAQSRKRQPGVVHVLEDIEQEYRVDFACPDALRGPVDRLQRSGDDIVHAASCQPGCPLVGLHPPQPALRESRFHLACHASGGTSDIQCKPGLKRHEPDGFVAWGGAVIVVNFIGEAQPLPYVLVPDAGGRYPSRLLRGSRHATRGRAAHLPGQVSQQIEKHGQGSSYRGCPQHNVSAVPIKPRCRSPRFLSRSLHPEPCRIQRRHDQQRQHGRHDEAPMIA